MGPPRAVIINLGAAGCLALVDGTVLEQLAVPVTPVDTVGAGDAFVGAYPAELLLERVRHLRREPGQLHEDVRLLREQPEVPDSSPARFAPDHAGQWRLAGVVQHDREARVTPHKELVHC
ncbi:MAG: PfkB family carbohydrate kinase [Actinomycetota bacterium]|nr:PfkB family carbohydrate kinase [Actinomycetota bacterium]